MVKVLVSSIFLVIVLFSNVSYAASYSVPSVITGITVGPTLVRVYLDDVSGEFETCTAISKKVAYSFDPSIPGNEFMLSAVLSAKVSNQKIMFQSVGCLVDYSKITHVYFCDTDKCQ